MSPDPTPPNTPSPDEWDDELGSAEEAVEPATQDEWGAEPEVSSQESPAEEWLEEEAGALPVRRQVKPQPEVHHIGGDQSAAEPDGEESEEKPVVTQLQVREIKGQGARPRLDRINEDKLDRVPNKPVSQDSIKMESRQTEDKEWGKAGGMDWKWVVGSGLAVILMLVLGLMLLPKLNKRDSVATNKDMRAKAQKEYVEERKNLIEELLLKQDEAEQIYLNYASAPIVDELLPLLRDRKRVEPLVRANRDGAVISKTWKPRDEFEWRVVSSQERLFGVLSGLLPNFQKFNAYFVIEDGDLFLDWEATVGYSSASYDELKKGYGDPSKIRGVIKPAVFYTAAYPEDEYVCFQLISPDDEETLWLYVMRDTRLEAMIAKLFIGGDIVRRDIRAQNITVALERGPEGAAPNQWLVKGLWHIDWVSP